MGRRPSVRALSAQALLASEDPEIQKLINEVKKLVYPEVLKEVKEGLERGDLKGQPVQKLLKVLGQVELDTRKPASSINMIQVPINNGLPETAKASWREGRFEQAAVDVEERRRIRARAVVCAQRLKNEAKEAQGGG